MLELVVGEENKRRGKLNLEAIADCYNRMSTNRDENYRAKQKAKCDTYLENLTALVEESCKSYVGNDREMNRLVMINFLQDTDPNGCYTDDVCFSDTGEILTYETAENYFLWYANSAIIEAANIDDATEAAVLIKELGLYACSMKVLSYLVNLTNRKDRERILKMNRVIWDLGAAGVIAKVKKEWEMD